MIHRGILPTGFKVPFSRRNSNPRRPCRTTFSGQWRMSEDMFVHPLSLVNPSWRNKYDYMDVLKARTQRCTYHALRLGLRHERINIVQPRYQTPTSRLIAGSPRLILASVRSLSDSDRSRSCPAGKQIMKIEDGHAFINSRKRLSPKA